MIEEVNGDDMTPIVITTTISRYMSQFLMTEISVFYFLTFTFSFVLFVFSPISVIAYSM